MESAPLWFALSKEEKDPRFWCLGILLFRHFHGPPAGRGKGAQRRRLACCMRCAASVSLRVAAMRGKTVGVIPARRYCAGWGKANRVSSGV